MKRTRVEIDPNVRIIGNRTYASFEDSTGPVSVGETVEVFESESGLHGEGLVYEVDEVGKFIYLQVDWSTLTTE